MRSHYPIIFKFHKHIWSMTAFTWQQNALALFAVMRLDKSCCAVDNSHIKTDRIYTILKAYRVERERHSFH